MTPGPDAFWALKNVSFQVRRGECLGIVGPNGAGKTTVLRLLAGVTQPTQGSISLGGRTGSLIDPLNAEAVGWPPADLDGSYVADDPETTVALQPES